jgi:hypothetical protein
VAAQVDGHNFVPRQQARSEVLPLVSVRGETVQENDSVGTGFTPPKDVRVPAIELNALAAAMRRWQLARRGVGPPRRHGVVFNQDDEGKPDKIPTEPIISIASIVTLARVLRGRKFPQQRANGW